MVSVTPTSCAPSTKDRKQGKKGYRGSRSTNDEGDEENRILENARYPCDKCKSRKHKDLIKCERCEEWACTVCQDVPYDMLRR